MILAGPIIFVDLDDFLVVAKWPTTPQTKASFKSFKLDGQTYYFSVRPLAHYMLSVLALVTHSKLCILTSATQEYAQAVNNLCKFVDPGNIVAREEYLTQVFDDKYDTVYQASTTNICPTGILLDHQPASELHTALKLKALGIEVDKYIQLPQYCTRYPDRLSPNKIIDVARKCSEMQREISTA